MYRLIKFCLTGKFDPISTFEEWDVPDELTIKHPYAFEVREAKYAGRATANAPSAAPFDTPRS